MNGASLQFDPPDVPRFSYRAEPSHFTGEFTDLDEGRHVRAPMVAQDQSFSRYRDTVQNRNLKFANLRFTVEPAAQHVQRPIAHDGREAGGEHRQPMPNATGRIAATHKRRCQIRLSATVAVIRIPALVTISERAYSRAFISSDDFQMRQQPPTAGNESEVFGVPGGIRTHVIRSHSPAFHR